MEKEPIKLKLNEDKIIDILMHAATREDIATARNELKTEIVEVKENITAVRSELKAEVVGIRSEIVGVKTKVDVRMDKLNDKIDKVIWFIVISILVPIFIQVAPHLLK